MNNYRKKEELVMPSSKSAEVMVIGSMLCNVNAVTAICPRINEEDFFHTEHKHIYRVIKDFYRKEALVDEFLIAEELERLKILAAAGGRAYLQGCKATASGALFEEYAQVVIEKSILRRLMTLGLDLHYQAGKDPGNVFALLDEAQQNLFDLGRSSLSDKSCTVSDLIAGKFDENNKSWMDKTLERKAYFDLHGCAMELPGVSSGFLDVDKFLGNLGNSNLIILAARPAMGKTAFMLNIAEHVALKKGKAVGIVSLEMSSEQLVSRLMISTAEVSGNRVKDGKLSPSEVERLFDAANRIQASKIVMDDQASLSVQELRSRARRWKEAHDIQILIVDYLQLMTSSGRGSKENRQQEVTEISRTLKIIAKELDVPVLCLSQLNRKSEERTDHRPKMSDLRESGAIEQDADVIMFLHRPEYYDPHNKQGQAECIVAKNRHGEVGTAALKFDKTFTKFANLFLEPIEAQRNRIFTNYQGE